MGVPETAELNHLRGYGGQEKQGNEMKSGRGG